MWIDDLWKMEHYSHFFSWLVSCLYWVSFISNCVVILITLKLVDIIKWKWKCSHTRYIAWLAWLPIKGWHTLNCGSSFPWFVRSFVHFYPNINPIMSGLIELSTPISSSLSLFCLPLWAKFKLQFVHYWFHCGSLHLFWSIFIRITNTRTQTVHCLYSTLHSWTWRYITNLHISTRKTWKTPLYLHTYI